MVLEWALVTPSKRNPPCGIPPMETAKLKIGSTKHEYHIGDVVRISKHKSVFDKSYSGNWTPELFKIVKVKPTKPPTYFLEDIGGTEIKGAFYEQELQRTKHPDVYLVERVLRHRRGAEPGSREHYVKWMGLPKKHNSWITDGDIV
ncbi:hypothetical protein NQ315_015515 [Exocentrus adspersus]|uniref:Chromo domain-containing protein n=1 Tax=Exocentrus adspersus TaxID=1586481 RepID=A0AAV8VND4_9CUCU|nr:hypothetical protein NQ315_015515 [Exocentrus adspersus]